MPAFAAVEAKAREIIEGDTGSGKRDPPASPAGVATRAVPSAATPKLRQNADSESPPSERASKRKPTPPPFDPIVAHEATHGGDLGAGSSDPATVAKRARIKRKNTEQSKSVEPISAQRQRTGDHLARSSDQTKISPPKSTPTPPRLQAPATPPEPKSSPALEAEDSGPSWHEEIFDDSWTSLEPRSAGFHAREEVRFLMKYCGVPRNGKILDVGCGVGRHAMEMASAGYHVVAIDRSRSYLTKAVEEANRTDLKIKFVEGDMRAFSLPPSFDAVTSLHTSFGYFSDRDNVKALRCMASSLAPGGQLILDVVNRDWVASIGARRLWWEHRGFLVMEDVIFRDDTGRLEVERTVVGENAPRWDQKFQVRLYTVAEYVEMFRTLGLDLIDVTGNLAHPGVYLGSSNHRMILRARKPTE